MSLLDSCLFQSCGLTSVMNTAVAKAYTMVLIPHPRDELRAIGTVSKLRAGLYPGIPTMNDPINSLPQAQEFGPCLIRVRLSAAELLPRGVQDRFKAGTGSRLVEAHNLTRGQPGDACQPALWPLQGWPHGVATPRQRCPQG
jgi:hypothetical protein